MAESPFVNLDAAHEYVGLLLEAVQQARNEVAQDFRTAVSEGVPRRGEALQLVAWKLERLEQQLDGSRRLMNDLRRLRRLLLGEADDEARPAEVARPDAEAPEPAREAEATEDGWE